MTVVSIDSDIPFDSNIYLLLGKKALLIDAGTGLDSKHIIDQIWVALNGLRLSGIILTHCHADHTGGLADLVSEFGCPAYISEPEVSIVSESDDSDVTVSRLFNMPFTHVPCNRVSDGAVFDIGEHKLSVIYTPGHTEGCICLYDDITKSLFSGDTVFAQGYGRTDLPTGSNSKLLQSLRVLSKVNIGKLYPGHGPISTDGNRSVSDAIAMMEVSY